MGCRALRGLRRQARPWRRAPQEAARSAAAARTQDAARVLGEAAVTLADEKLLGRFEARYVPEPNTGCWIWMAGQNGAGYGEFWVDGRNQLAHRVAYEIFVGPIPVGLQVDHVRARGCSLRCCVNPAHLEPVTPRENTLRGDSPLAAHARKTCCSRCGSPLSGDNLISYDLRRGMRSCRACKNARRREPAYRAKRAQQMREQRARKRGG